MTTRAEESHPICMEGHWRPPVQNEEKTLSQPTPGSEREDGYVRNGRASQRNRLCNGNSHRRCGALSNGKGPLRTLARSIPISTVRPFGRNNSNAGGASAFDWIVLQVIQESR